MYEQNLADCTQVLGPDHPQTLITCANLAYTYQSAGNLDRAVPLYEQAVTYSLRVLGGDHPTTVMLRRNLAVAAHRV